MTSSQIKPLVKWIGGKRRQVHHLLRDFPSRVNSYHEPFVGGGSVLFAVLQNSDKLRVTDTFYAFDTNEPLIYMYKNVQEDPENVFRETCKLGTIFCSIPDNPDNVSNRTPVSNQEALSSRESHYYWVRSLYNKMTRDERKSVLGTAYFIFLNKLCFRGLFRVSGNGFNVPFGNYRNPEIINRNHVLAVSALIKPVVFRCMDFREALCTDIVKPGDFVYLDPPYAPINPTSFVKYSINGFISDDHLALFECVKTFNDRHVLFVMSNSDVCLVTDTFSEYKIQVISCRRAINPKKPGSMVNEVIISNVY